MSVIAERAGFLTSIQDLAARVFASLGFVRPARRIPSDCRVAIFFLATLKAAGLEAL